MRPAAGDWQSAFGGALLAALVNFRKPETVNLNAWAALTAITLSAFVSYAIIRTAWLPYEAAQSLAVEAVTALAVNLLLTAWLVRTPRDVIIFLVSMVAVATAASVFIGLLELRDGSPLPVAPFYRSRVAPVVAIVLIYFACIRQKVTLTAVPLLALAGLLVFFGLATDMRAAAVLYVPAILIALVFLAANRQLAAVCMTVIVLVIAYTSHVVMNGDRAAAKFHSYSPTVTREDTPPTYQVDIPACLKKAEVFLQGRVPSETELRHVCNRFFTLDDRDGRLRLVLHALTSTPSPMFGAGLGRYEFVDAARPDSPPGRYTYPHNIIAEAYHSAGLIGLVLMALSMALAIVLAIRACSNVAIPVSLLLAVPVFAALSSLVGGNLYDARLLWVFPIIMAALTPEGSREAGR